jgi:tight adherence protein B
MLQLGTFLAVTVGLFALFQVAAQWLRPGGTRARQRLAAEFGPASPEHARPALYRDLEALSLADAASLGSEAHLAPRPPSPGLRKRLEALLQEAHVPLRVGPFLALTAAGAVGLGGAAAYFGGWIAGVVACVVGAVGPFVFLRAKRKTRQEKFLRQLPGAFELMARVIRAGQSVPQALQAVVEAHDDPLAGEFASCEHQQSLGLRPEVAFREMAQRSGILELRIFVMAMLVQRQTGGNVSEVLDRLAGLMRARLRLRQQVRALTAEGRLQGISLVLLPIFTFFAMYYLNRSYALVLLEHGRWLLAAGAGMLIGVLWIRKIVNLDA